MRRFLIVLAVVIAAAVGVPRADAQIVNEAGPFAQPLLRRGVEQYARLLGLDAEQRTQALDLYVGYKAAYRALVKEGNAAVDKAGDVPDARVDTSKARFKAAKAFIDGADRLEASYFEDLGALLRPEQAPAMERVKRARTREVGTRFEFVSGEGIDLVEIAEALKIERTGEVAEALDQYEQDADRALTLKHEGFVRLFAKVMENGELEGDPEFMEEAIGGIYRTGIKVRNVNREHARRIAAALPDEQRAAWLREVQKRSYPRIYAESRVETLARWALARTDLTPGQREELTLVRDAHAAEAAASNAALCEALSAAQEDVPEHVMEAMSEQRLEDHPLEVAIRARRAVEDRHTDRLMAVLSQAQQAEAPAREEGDLPFAERAQVMPDLNEQEAHDELEKDG